MNVYSTLIEYLAVVDSEHLSFGRSQEPQATFTSAAGQGKSFKIRPQASLKILGAPQAGGLRVSRSTDLNIG